MAETKEVHAAWMRVRQALTHVARDGRVKGPNTDYRYVSDDALLNAFRPLFDEESLDIHPDVESYCQNGDHTIVLVRYSICHLPSGEEISYRTLGQSRDLQGRAGAKAQTDAEKMFLRKHCLLPSTPGDEPEKDSKQPEPGAQPEPLPKSAEEVGRRLVDELGERLSGNATTNDLRYIEELHKLKSGLGIDDDTWIDTLEKWKGVRTVLELSPRDRKIMVGKLQKRLKDKEATSE